MAGRLLARSITHLGNLRDARVAKQFPVLLALLVHALAMWVTRMDAAASKLCTTKRLRTRSTDRSPIRSHAVANWRSPSSIDPYRRQMSGRNQTTWPDGKSSTRSL